MTAVETARDALFGNPPSPTMEPSREGILAAFATLETALGNVSLGASTSVVKATKALIDADLAHDEGAIGIVWNDATDANNDLYVKVGESGTGSWQNTGALSETLSALSYPYVVLAESWADTSEGFAGDAETAAAAAGASEASAAEHAATAAAAAITAPGVYETTGDGLAAVGEGETFWVESVDGPVLYRKESGVAVEIDTLPGLGRVEAAEATATEAKESVDLLGTILNPLSNGPSVEQFGSHNFLNSTVSASAVAAGTVDQPNINGGVGYITSFTGDGTTDDFVVSPGFVVENAAYRNILVYLVTLSTRAETLQTETTHYTVAGKGTGTITITMLTPPTSAQGLRVRVYRKEDSAYNPLLNFVTRGYDNFNDGSGPMLVMDGAHHVNIANPGGHNSFGGGAGNQMRGGTSYSYAAGLSHDLNGALAGYAGGMRGYLTGTGPAHFGASGKVGGLSVHFGEQGEAETLYSAHFARRGKSRIAGDTVIGNGAAADTAAGMADFHKFPTRRTLTSTTTTSLVPPTGTSTFVMDDNSTAFVRAIVSLVEPATGDFRILEVTGTCQRGSGAASTSMTGASSFTELKKSAGLAPAGGTWEALLVASTGAGGFGLFGKGATSKTIIAQGLVTDVIYTNHAAASV